MPTKMDEPNDDRIISFDWLFGKNLSPEEEERRRREEKIRDLLPDEEEDELLGKAYDGRLVKRLLTYIKPYGVKITLAVILMIVSSLMAVAGPWLIGLAIDEGVRTGNVAVGHYFYHYRYRRVDHQPQPHYDYGLCGHQSGSRYPQPSFPAPAQPVAQFSQQLQRGAADEPADQ